MRLDEAVAFVIDCDQGISPDELVERMHSLWAKPKPRRNLLQKAVMGCVMEMRESGSVTEVLNDEGSHLFHSLPVVVGDV